MKFITSPAKSFRKYSYSRKQAAEVAAIKQSRNRLKREDVLQGRINRISKFARKSRAHIEGPMPKNWSWVNAAKDAASRVITKAMRQYGQRNPKPQVTARRRLRLRGLTVVRKQLPRDVFSYLYGFKK